MRLQLRQGFYEAHEFRMVADAVEVFVCGETISREGLGSGRGGPQPSHRLRRISL